MSSVTKSGYESADPPTDIERACAWLCAAERPVVIAGRGAVWSNASQALLELCARVPKLRVASTPGAKGVFPEHHPQALGVWGFSGHAAARRAVSACDVLLVVGSRLLEQSSSEWHPRLRGPRVVRIDLEARRLVTRTEHSLALTGDVREVLAAIHQGLATRIPQLVHALGAVREPSAIARVGDDRDGDRFVSPSALFSVLSCVASETPLCADAGNAMCWAIEWLERRRPRDFQVSLDWGTMGFALPAAIGITLARPGQPAIAVTGDGSMAMAGGDLHTAVELELPIIVVVLNDGGAGMVRAGSEAWFGPNAVPDCNYRYKLNFTAYARGLGAHGELVTSSTEFESQLRLALKRATPTVFDVQVDPNEVPAAVRQRVKGLAGAETESATETGRHGGGMC